MKFGPAPLDQAEGAILAHSIGAGSRRLRKGLRLTAADVAALAAQGVAEVVVARLDVGDVHEDAAAERLAQVVAGDGIEVAAPFTGRSNLTAVAAGVLVIDTGALHAINAVDEAVTLATLPPFARVAARQMVGTVKIIPYAVPQTSLDAALAATHQPPLRIAPFCLSSADLIVTRTPGQKAALIDKGIAAVEARVAGLGLTLDRRDVVAHEADAVRDALRGTAADLVVILGGSATSDRSDVCPAGLVAAGGAVTRFGIPVDPGNLLFLGELGTRPVVGLPGCARSPALNGADWVLERVVAGLGVDDDDFAALGLGGLLKEISTRPQPRQGNRQAPQKPRVSILLLAAGQSRRMGGSDKLLQDAGGVPLVRRCAEAAMAAKADEVLVIAGPHNRDGVAAALAGTGLEVVTAQDAATGMAASLRAGLAARHPAADAVIVALADMPEVTAEHLNCLMAAFDPAEGRSIARALAEDGKPGHPVMFGKRFFEALEALDGDAGARAILKSASEFLVEVPTPGQGAVIDLDTPAAWEAWREDSGA